MGKNGLVIFLVLGLACATIFLGCASVPKEELDEKEAVIKNLNMQIDGLKQEITRLRQSNEELMNAKSQLEEKLMKLQKTQTAQEPIEEKPGPKVK